MGSAENRILWVYRIKHLTKDSHFWYGSILASDDDRIPAPGSWLVIPDPGVFRFDF